ncbi:MAG: WXG100 family type VII secretion target [Ruminococcus sp.]|nr:WXG100 family type VII secretion target [Ruminococcus sp.]
MKIKTNTNSLNAKARTVEESIQNVERMINKLESDYTELDAMWDGPASEVYGAVFKNDIRILKRCAVKLRAINAYEKDAKNKYESCEIRVESEIASAG